MGSAGGGPPARLRVGPPQPLRARSHYLSDGNGHADPPHPARPRGAPSLHPPSRGGGDEAVPTPPPCAPPRDARPGQRLATPLFPDGDPLRRHGRARLGIDRPDPAALDRAAAEAQRQSPPTPTDVPAAASDPDLHRGLPDAVPGPVWRES